MRTLRAAGWAGAQLSVSLQLCSRLRCREAGRQAARGGLPGPSGSMQRARAAGSAEQRPPLRHVAQRWRRLQSCNRGPAAARRDAQTWEREGTGKERLESGSSCGDPSGGEGRAGAVGAKNPRATAQAGAPRRAAPAVSDACQGPQQRVQPSRGARPFSKHAPLGVWPELPMPLPPQTRRGHTCSGDKASKREGDPALACVRSCPAYSSVSHPRRR